MMNSKHYVGRIYRLKDYHKIHCRETPQSKTKYIEKTSFNEMVAVFDETRKLIKTFTKNGNPVWISKHYLGSEVRDEIEDNPCKILNNVVDSLIQIGDDFPNLSERLQKSISEIRKVNTELEKAF